jgi:hypothetical protein
MTGQLRAEWSRVAKGGGLPSLMIFSKSVATLLAMMKVINWGQIRRGTE